MKITSKPWSTRLLPLMAALVLAGCASGPAIDDAALPVTPQAYKEQTADGGRWTQAVAAEATARGEWWKAFKDPVLDDLVARADVNNGSIQVAAARLAQARALARSADADRLPQAGLRAGGNRLKDATTGNIPATVYSAGAVLSYETDLFGKLSDASRAAKLDAESRAGLLQSTRLLVQSQVAQTYLNLRALDVERELVRDTVTAYRGSLDLTERRYRAGDVAELDVARVAAEVAANESEALSLDRSRAALEHSLAVLVGEVASNFHVAPVAWNTALPVIPAGVPSTVLARRPDVSAAQNTLLAAQARAGAAKKAWFPDLTLTASGGYASADLGDLFKWSARVWGVGALLSLPVFDGGRRSAGIQSAQAEFDAQLATYRDQILGAFRDVEDQLSALRLLEAQSEAQGRAVASASRATVLSDSRYRNGLVSQLDLLDAQRSELRNRRQALQVKSAQYQATVGLIRALGGSWEVPAATTTQAPATQAVAGL